MRDARLADALARLNEHHTLHLPLRRGDAFGRLALRFLWLRQLKWQMEVNLAARDAIDRICELAEELSLGSIESGASTELVTRQQLRAELDAMHRSDQNITAGLNQRLYALIGSVRTELSDLRLQLTDNADNGEAVETRLRAVEDAVAALTAQARDARLRNAHVDLVLDEVRSTLPASTEQTEHRDITAPPDRSSFIELAVAELVDGPVEHTRARRGAYVPVVEQARAKGAIGPVFDMTPWRGEWFEALRSTDAGYRSASRNPLVVKHGADLGCEVAEADPMDVLAGSPKRSFGAVTAFRFVERLDPSAVARLVDLAATSLQPGGVLLVETPNPSADAARDFHLDPFALRPVHPTFLRFLVEAAGFSDVEIRYPAEGPFGGWPTELSAGTADKAERYCLIAWR